MPKSGELPVYPMTAIDEITYRTPDALYNGEATAKVIQSCVPNIKDPWAMPATDLNSVLVAIRIASYGHELDLETRCPKCNTEGEYSVDLRTVLDTVVNPDFTKTMQYGDLEITFQPMDYHTQTETNKKQFEQQKTIQTVQYSDLPDEEKVELLNQALQNITNLTIEALKYSIASIRTPQSLVTEMEFIEEFLKNCDRKFYVTLRDHIIDLREKSEFKPYKIACNNCGHEYQQSIQLDQSNFFGRAS
jgi:hypothetical protein